MRFTVSFAACAILLSGVAHGAVSASEADEIRALRTQIELLNERLAALEARTGVTAAPAPAPQQAAAVAAAPGGTPDAALDWARRISVKGDFRYRHETIDLEGAPETFNRQRIRARVALKAKVNDTVDAVFGLASGGDDPRSTNQTLTNASSSKDVRLDLAYADWHPLEGLHVFGGKMKYPTFRPSASIFIDPDVNPEGVAATWDTPAGWFANVRGFWVFERPQDNDSMQYGAQLGWHGTLGSAALTAALGYDDFSNVQGRQPYFLGPLGSSFGNSVDADGALLYDFDIVDASVELGMKAAGLPLAFFAETARNTRAGEFDTAWTAGIALGKAGDPGTWELSYAYADVEKDALFGQLVDSDFGNGFTDSRGHIVKAGYALSRNWIANLTYFINEVNVDVGERRDYDRLQVDLNFKY